MLSPPALLQNMYTPQNLFTYTNTASQDFKLKYAYAVRKEHSSSQLLSLLQCIHTTNISDSDSLFTTFYNKDCVLKLKCGQQQTFKKHKLMTTLTCINSVQLNTNTYPHSAHTHTHTHALMHTHTHTKHTHKHTHKHTQMRY